jgi:hypothetical protein
MRKDHEEGIKQRPYGDGLSAPVILPKRLMAAPAGFPRRFWLCRKQLLDHEWNMKTLLSGGINLTSVAIGERPKAQRTYSAIPLTNPT